MAEARRWIRRACALCALLSAASARADETADRLRQAANLTRESAWDEAVAALPDVSNVERSHLPLLESVASALVTQRPSAAAHLLAAARRLDPEAVRPRAALEALWAANPALDGLDAADITQFPVDAETVSVPGLEIVTLVAKPFVRTPPAISPSTGAAFPATANVYTASGGRLTLRVMVHAAEGIDVSRARQVGRFLAALSDLTDPILGAANRASFPMPVWLETRGEAGARQWKGSITVHASAALRTDLEWMRELAHEWGHAALPGIDGFTQPEAWANGDIGERLFLPMMAEAGRLDAWTRGANVTAYTRRYVTPAAEAWAREGPSPALLKDTGQKGYDQFLGECLYIQQAYGTALLVEALDGAGGGNAADFDRTFRDTLASRTTVEVRRTGPAGPRPICIPRAARYTLEGTTVRRNGRAPRSPERLPAGWTMVEWQGLLTVRSADAKPHPGKVTR